MRLSRRWKKRTHSADGISRPAGPTEIAALGEPSSETVVAFSSDPISAATVDVAEAEEVNEASEEEAELEEAQAEAEALLDAEGQATLRWMPELGVRAPAAHAPSRNACQRPPESALRTQTSRQQHRRPPIRLLAIINKSRRSAIY